MFGGTDPSDLMKKIYDIVKQIGNQYPYISFNFITGAGFSAEERGIFEDIPNNIFVYKDVKNVSDYMANADLAFTSQGRTVFELAAMGVPAIVLAQNEREQLHTFAWLVNTPQIRKKMRELMLRNRLDKSIDRVIDIILHD